MTNYQEFTMRFVSRNAGDVVRDPASAGRAVE